MESRLGDVFGLDVDSKRGALAVVLVDAIGDSVDLLGSEEGGTAEGGGAFDLTFIDADKQSIPEYFRFARKLSSRGSLIIIDNIVRDGRVIDAGSHDPDIQGIRRFNQLLAAEPGVCATAIQTVGAKGHDGFASVLVTV